MMSEPLTTIVIPAYNAERYIERTLQSATRQTFPNIEIVVVDDGSTDNTRQLADAAARIDSRIRVLSIPNGGVANARNVGMTEARGEYVAFLDADDLWHPTKIAAQMEAILTPVDGVLPAFSYTLMRSIDESDLVKGAGRPLALSGYALARHTVFTPVGNGSSVLVRRDVALELGGYDPIWAARGIGGCEDLDFELKAAAKYPVAAVPLYLVGYRQYPGNMSSQRTRMARSAVETIEKHIAANPALPRWAIRMARESVFDYAFKLLMDGRHWWLAVHAISRLTLLNPVRGMRSVLGHLRNKVKGELGTIKGKLGIRRHNWPLPMNHFDDFDPTAKPTGTTFSRRDQRLLERLTVLDKALSERHGGKIVP